MKKARKIQDFDPLYWFLRYYVDVALKLSYRTVRYVGRERIPQEGAIIYAPNHTNALMDALVILAMDRSAKVFVARADIFKNPRLAKILRFLKIMPIMRMRDGYEELKKNNETIEKAVDVLHDRVPFCIFPEGTHQAKYSTLPLAKGIFRIAFQAQELMPDLPLYIVPVGLRYGNFFRFRSTVRVEIGEPICIGGFIKEHSDLSTQEQINLAREMLTERMKERIFYIPDNEEYDALYEICAAVVKQQVRLLPPPPAGERRHSLDAHFIANRTTLEWVTRLKSEQPEVADRLIALGDKAAKIRTEHQISLASVSIRYPILSRILKFLFLLITLPYNLGATLLTSPVILICHLLTRRFKDNAFHNSVRYLVNLLMWPLMMLLYALIAYLTLPWQWALPLTLLILPAPIITQESYRLLRLMVSDIQLLKHRELRAIYQEIRFLMFHPKVKK